MAGLYLVGANSRAAGLRKPYEEPEDSFRTLKSPSARLPVHQGYEFLVSADSYPNGSKCSSGHPRSTGAGCPVKKTARLDPARHRERDWTMAKASLARDMGLSAQPDAASG